MWKRFSQGCGVFNTQRFECRGWGNEPLVFPIGTWFDVVSLGFLRIQVQPFWLATPLDFSPPWVRKSWFVHWDDARALFREQARQPGIVPRSLEARSMVLHQFRNAGDSNGLDEFL